MMRRHFINDKVEFWHNGDRQRGTVYSARRSMFGRIKYVIAVRVFNKFDPDGIGQERYKYITVPEEDIVAGRPATTNTGDNNE